MLGARIAALRRERGMSQAELADKLGCSASAVGMYEQGRREPSVDMLVELSRILEVSTDYLLTGGVRDEKDRRQLHRALQHALCVADEKLEHRRERPFSREELAVLMAAMLVEP
jgi:transcriptional regulator with XRE-family HTH domain